MDFKEAVLKKSEALGIKSSEIERAFARFINMMGEQEVRMFINDMNSSRCGSCGDCGCK